MPRKFVLLHVILLLAILPSADAFQFGEAAVKRMLNLILHHRPRGTEDKCTDAMLGMVTSGNSSSALLPFLMNTGSGLNDLGDFDGCLKNGETNRYITLHVRFLPIAVALGLCPPKECTPASFEDLRAPLAEIVTELTNSMKGSSEINLTVTAENVWFVDPIAQEKSQTFYGPGFVLTVSILSILFLVCVISTVFVAQYSSKGPSEGTAKTVYEWATSFDLNRNWKELTVNPRRGESELSFLDGIRVLGITWVIFGHTFYTAADFPVINSDDIQAMTIDFSKAHIYGGTLSVDIFFFLSAFLITYILLRRSKGKPKLGLMIYVHRVIRLYPLVIVTLVTFCFILPVLSNGPLYYRVYEKINKYCAAIWYRIMLFFVNWRPWGYDCIDNVWYISLDFQLFAVTPFIVVLYSKKKLLGILVPVLVIVVNVVVTIWMSYKYDIWSSFSKYNHDYEDLYYEKPYTRAGPYMIGILAGYFYYEHKSGNNETVLAITGAISNNVVVRLVLYVAGLMGMFWMVHAMYWLDKYYQTIPRVYDLMHLVFSRDIFAIALFLFCLPGLVGKGRVQKLLLGNHFFFVMGKLSYGGYLLHQMYMEYFIYTRQKPMYFGYAHLCMEFWAYMLLAFVTAALSFLFVEQPVFNLERMLLMPKRKEEPKLEDEKAKLTVETKE